MSSNKSVNPEHKKPEKEEPEAELNRLIEKAELQKKVLKKMIDEINKTKLRK